MSGAARAPTLDLFDPKHHEIIHGDPEAPRVVQFDELEKILTKFVKGDAQSLMVDACEGHSLAHNERRVAEDELGRLLQDEPFSKDKCGALVQRALSFESMIDVVARCCAEYSKRDKHVHFSLYKIHTPMAAFGEKNNMVYSRDDLINNVTLSFSSIKRMSSASDRTGLGPTAAIVQVIGDLHMVLLDEEHCMAAWDRVDPLTKFALGYCSGYWSTKLYGSTYLKFLRATGAIFSEADGGFTIDQQHFTVDTTTIHGYLIKEVVKAALDQETEVSRDEELRFGSTRSIVKTFLIGNQQLYEELVALCSICVFLKAGQNIKGWQYDGRRFEIVAAVVVAAVAAAAAILYRNSPAGKYRVPAVALVAVIILGVAAAKGGRRELNISRFLSTSLLECLSMEIDLPDYLRDVAPVFDAIENGTPDVVSVGKISVIVYETTTLGRPVQFAHQSQDDQLGFLEDTVKVGQGNGKLLISRVRENHLYLEPQRRDTFRATVREDGNSRLVLFKRIDGLLVATAKNVAQRNAYFLYNTLRNVQVLSNSWNGPRVRIYKVSAASYWANRLFREAEDIPAAVKLLSMVLEGSIKVKKAHEESNCAFVDVVTQSDGGIVFNSMISLDIVRRLVFYTDKQKLFLKVGNLDDYYEVKRVSRLSIRLTRSDRKHNHGLLKCSLLSNVCLE